MYCKVQVDITVQHQQPDVIIAFLFLIPSI